MKRIIAILLTVLLLGMLTACDQNVGRHADGIIKADKATFEIGKTHTSFEGMNIQIANAIWNDEEIKLDVNWINKTGYDVVYGSSYDIERENNGEWSSCVTLEDLAFTSIGYELKAGATQKKTYNLTDVFDISQDGKYHLTTDCFIYDKGRGGKSTECKLWVEFTVTRIGDTSGDVYGAYFNERYIDGLSVRKYAEAHNMNRGSVDHLNRKFIAELAAALKARDEADGVCRLHKRK